MKVLIVVDMQNDFISGTLANVNADKIISNINDKIRAMNDEDLVLFTKDKHNATYYKFEESKYVREHCQHDTIGEQIDNRILYNSHNINHIIVSKDTFAAKRICDILMAYNIKNIESVELCGTIASICVISNALMIRSFLPQTAMYIHKNCIADLDDDMLNSAINIMKNCCINIIED